MVILGDIIGDLTFKSPAATLSLTGTVLLTRKSYALVRIL